MRPIASRAPLVLLSFATAALGNPANDMFSRMPERERNAAFTDYMGKTAEPCTVERTFFQGFTSGTRGDVVWSIACTNKKTYAIMLKDDTKGSSRLIECDKLKVATKGARECFKKY